MRQIIHFHAEKLTIGVSDCTKSGSATVRDVSSGGSPIISRQQNHLGSSTGLTDGSDDSLYRLRPGGNAGNYIEHASGGIICGTERTVPSWGSFILQMN